MERQKESVGWSERETIIRHLEQRVRTLEEASQERYRYWLSIGKLW